uniref:Glycoside hydrolase family 5 n=1 Tax=uncultured bacterium contig00061 TaxID=1181544 RepID=A0A806KH08_9BACT|nr:glycoside hydrolase family 5 [uncultured bacterium contig00061]
MNEPRTRNIPEGTSPNEWSGGTAEERANLNKYYQAFVDTVRTSGGNNDKRILMINTYGAFSGAVAVNAVVLPTDTVANKLIVTIHGYVPYNFAYPESTTTWSSSNPSDTDPVLGVFQPAYDKFVSQGVPVIIGEFGTVDTNHDGTTNVLADRAAYTEYYVSQAKAKGIKCVIFDNGIHIYSAEDNTVEVFGLLNRTDNTWRLPEIIAALMRGADADVSTPTPPTTITGNLGNYRFGTNDGVNYTNYDQAVWELTPTQVTTAQSAGAKLVLQLSGAPSARLDLVWQNPDTESYWNEKGILGENGNILNGSSVTWNANTLTINLDANTVEDYADTFTSAASLNLIIVYYGGSSVNDLGIVSANLVAEGGGANVITNPAPSVYGEENQTITSISDGVVSVNNPAGTNTGAGFSYEFPSDWATYTTVTIDYTLTITAGTAAKVTLKSGKNSYEGDIELNGVQYSQYQDFTGTGGTLVLQTVWFDDTKMDTPGISFQVNNYELAADMTFTFKVNSLTFE